jgi:hypothetical protein
MNNFAVNETTTKNFQHTSDLVLKNYRHDKRWGNVDADGLWCTFNF